ncbi:hypothetical protein PLANPX_1883 [Lacipirellula parvula]|uniref:Uncharacterized protein n=1 Tax=Lacipirellula parvula TaxID=2650471 RepID=A0A5K7XBN9_9BACT|nr:hypothetical protein PLANPX_1883 [Lacipirellula parvula]
MRFEPLRSLDMARSHYRRNEESAAANEIDKATSWLKLAESTASPADKEKLTSVASELSTLAKDIRSGDIVAAEKLDGELGKAAQALAGWHYSRAKDAQGKNNDADAGHDLELAAAYLQHAANSAHVEFGPDVQEVITRTYRHGKLTSESATVQHDNLGKDLQQIEKAIHDLGEQMVKAAKVAKS